VTVSDLRPADVAPPPGQAARLSATLFVVSAIHGLGIAFFPVWLAARGLNEDEIGLLLAMPLAATVFATPVIMRYAERAGRIAACFIASAVGIALSHAAMALAPGVGALFVAAILMAIARAPLSTLGDALTFALIARDPSIDYGRVRLWVSVSVLVAMLVGGFAVERIAPERIIWLIVAWTGVGALAAIVLTPRAGDRAARAATPAAPAQLQRKGAIVAVIAAAALVQASHAVLYSFGSLHWRAQGASGDFIGLAWSVGLVCEISLFAASRRFSVEARAPFYLALGAAGASVRWLAMTLDPSGPALLALQGMHAFSFGATHLGSVFLLVRLAPAAFRAQAQGWLTSAIGLSLMAATAASGPLYRLAGEQAYGLMAAFALGGFVCALVAGRLAAQPQSAGSGG
jgi:PPP family 3-phenylpropionic acid transporter